MLARERRKRPRRRLRVEGTRHKADTPRPNVPAYPTSGFLERIVPGIRPSTVTVRRFFVAVSLPECRAFLGTTALLTALLVASDAQTQRPSVLAASVALTCHKAPPDATRLARDSATVTDMDNCRRSALVPPTRPQMCRDQDLHQVLRQAKGAAASIAQDRYRMRPKVDSPKLTLK